MKNRAAYLIAIVVSMAMSLSARADIALPKILGTGMVLQRDTPIHIWGSASAGEQIAVQFAGQQQTATADASGKWAVTLDPLAASAEPRQMTISGNNMIVLKDILVGEVWLCGGQSNMEYPMGRGAAYKPPRTGPDLIPDDLAKSADAQIRLFRVEKVASLPDLTSTGWKSCDPTSLAAFSAVGYYFGREIHQQLKVPIGLIQSAWGGTRIEPWTPGDAYAAVPGFKDDLAKVADATKPPMIDGAAPGKLYRSMILPMIPFGIRGVIWYQGESNIIPSNDSGPRYADKMNALETSWRSAWKEGDFPFYQVEIAPYLYTQRKDPLKHTALAEPDLWEGQTLALRLPNTGLAATIDITDNVADIHPPDKWDVGHRLALWALAKDYGQKKLIYHGPMFKQLSIEGSKARVSFDPVGNDLVSSDDKPLVGFTIAGEDGNFVPAAAAIDGSTVLVRSPDVAAPVAVRYGWTENPTVNLANKEGLPAYPFRTDGPMGK
jgi:sialate O-acetylesterase